MKIICLASEKIDIPSLNVKRVHSLLEIQFHLFIEKKPLSLVPVTNLSTHCAIPCHVPFQLLA